MNYNFKPGDKARIVGNQSNFGFPSIGLTVVVERVNPINATVSHNGSEYFAYLSDLEPIPSGQFYVGQDVWDRWLYPGVKGKVLCTDSLRETTYPVCVAFGEIRERYTKDGCYSKQCFQTLYPYDYDIQITPARFVPEANTPVNALDEGWWVAAIFINTTTDGRYLVRYGTRAYLVDRIEPYNPALIGKTDNP